MDLDGSGLTIHSQPADWLRQNGATPEDCRSMHSGSAVRITVLQVEEALEDKDAVLIRKDGIGRFGCGGGMQKLGYLTGSRYSKVKLAVRIYRLAVVAEKEQDALVTHW